jgi:Ca-activated chloride channel family protein
MIVFEHVWILALLPLPLVVRKLLPPFEDVRQAVRVPLFDVLVDSIGATPSKGAVVRKRTPWQAIVYVIVWTSVLVALARPQWLQPPVVQEIPTRDLLLAIDLSGSMETADVQNASGDNVDRLTAVKEVLDDFLANRQGDRVGMIVFGTGAFVQIPFTQDLDVCRELLDQTAVRMAGPRTAFGDAIGLGITLFQRSDLDDNVLIALTDGNDTGSKVPPTEAAKIAADNGIVIHTIGVGDPTAAGEEKFDEQVLKDVASETGGRYFFAGDREQLKEIYAELDRLDQRKVETISHQPKQDYFFIPVAIGFLVSLVYFLVRSFHLRRRKASRDLVSAATADDEMEVAA